MDETTAAARAADTVHFPGLTRPDIPPLLPEEEAEEAAAAAPAAPRVMAAEWALWGKEADETAYRVLRCSRGSLSEKDFSEVITRYSPGEPEKLPQYTVSWIPGADRKPEYIALGVHELAPAGPRRPGGRSRRDAAGREIVFVRLFCLRYAELAGHVLTYQDQVPGYLDLIKAVAGVQLTGGRGDLVRVTLPDQPSLLSSGALRKQAEQVAIMLLTGRQVCVLGADDTKAAERLRFIDTVMAMLPYGLRASMSAATSASSTSLDLKLRLFFAGVPRAGGRQAGGRLRGEDFIVNWGKPDDASIADQAAQLYRQWLKEAKSAPALLADQVRPVRFTAPDIRRMVGNLPADKSVLETLADLAEVMGAPDAAPDAVKNAVRDATKRLRRYLAGEDQPADPAEVQEGYRHSVCRHRLLAANDQLSPQLKGPLYEQLLRVAFGPALTYDGFCDIEASTGVPLPVSLRTALAKFPASDSLAYLLAREGQPGFRSGAVLADGLLPSSSEPADDLISGVTTGRLRPRHGAVVLDWALSDLGRRAGIPTEFLAARYYLAPVCEYLYPGDLDTQVRLLKQVLVLAFGGELLGKPQIDYVFTQPDSLTAGALGQAVTAMAAGGRMRRYADELAYLAQLRASGAPDWQVSPRPRRGWRPWRRRRPPAPPGQPGRPRPAAHATAAGPRNYVLSTDSPWAHPRTLGIALVVILVLFSVAYFGVLLTLRGG